MVLLSMGSYFIYPHFLIMWVIGQCHLIILESSSCDISDTEILLYYKFFSSSLFKPFCFKRFLHVQRPYRYWFYSFIPAFLPFGYICYFYSLPKDFGYSKNSNISVN